MKYKNIKHYKYKQLNIHLISKLYNHYINKLSYKYIYILSTNTIKFIVYIQLHLHCLLFFNCIFCIENIN